MSLFRTIRLATLVAAGIAAAVHFGGCSNVDFNVAALAMPFQHNQFNTSIQDYNVKAQAAKAHIDVLVAEQPSNTGVTSERQGVYAHAAQAEALAEEAQLITDQNQTLFEQRDSIAGLVGTIEELKPLYRDLNQKKTGFHSNSRTRVGQAVIEIGEELEAQEAILRKMVRVFDQIRDWFLDNPEIASDYLPTYNLTMIAEATNSVEDMLVKNLQLQNVGFDVTEPNTLLDDLSYRHPVFDHFTEVSVLSNSIGDSLDNSGYGASPAADMLSDIYTTMKSTSSQMLTQMGNNTDRLRELNSEIAVHASEGTRGAWQASAAAGRPIPDDLPPLASPFNGQRGIPAWNSTFWDFSS